MQETQMPPKHAANLVANYGERANHTAWTVLYGGTFQKDDFSYYELQDILRLFADYSILNVNTVTVYMSICSDYV